MLFTDIGSIFEHLHFLEFYREISGFLLKIRDENIDFWRKNDEILKIFKYRAYVSEKHPSAALRAKFWLLTRRFETFELVTTLENLPLLSASSKSLMVRTLTTVCTDCILRRSLRRVSYSLVNTIRSGPKFSPKPQRFENRRKSKTHSRQIQIKSTKH